MAETFKSLGLDTIFNFNLPSVVNEALPKLPYHLPTIKRSALVFWAIQTLSQVLSPKIRAYRALDPKVQNRWNAKVVCESTSEAEPEREGEVELNI